jgi:hypothetical protein
VFQSEALSYFAPTRSVNQPLVFVRLQVGVQTTLAGIKTPEIFQLPHEIGGKMIENIVV